MSNTSTTSSQHALVQPHPCLAPESAHGSLDEQMEPPDSMRICDLAHTAVVSSWSFAPSPSTSLPSLKSASPATDGHATNTAVHRTQSSRRRRAPVSPITPRHQSLGKHRSSSLNIPACKRRKQDLDPTKDDVVRRVANDWNLCSIRKFNVLRSNGSPSAALYLDIYECPSSHCKEYNWGFKLVYHDGFLTRYQVVGHAGYKPYLAVFEWIEANKDDTFAKAIHVGQVRDGAYVDDVITSVQQHGDANGWARRVLRALAERGILTQGQVIGARAAAEGIETDGRRDRSEVDEEPMVEDGTNATTGWSAKERALVREFEALFDD